MHKGTIAREGLPYRVQNAIGRTPDVFGITTVAGQNDFNASASFVMIWQSPSIEPLHNSAHPASFVSTSNQDSSTGTGWRSVKIWGLDNNFNFAYDEFPTNGTTPAVGQQPFRRVYRVQAGSLGSANQAVGSITLTQSVTNEQFAREVQNVNELRKCYYPIPAGYYGIVRALDTAPQGTNIYDCRLWARSPTGRVRELCTIGHFRRSDIQFAPGILVPPRYEVFPVLRWNSNPERSTGNAIMDLVLVKEEFVVDKNIFNPLSLGRNF